MEANEHPRLAGVPAEIYEDDEFRRKFVIETELGVGGSGVVVAAKHRELDERVAIKFLHPGRQNAQAIARFRREARAANRIKNEHVVRIIDVSTTASGIPYVVMEYLEGLDLERLLLQSPARQLPVRDAIEFILQACEALAECHRNGIVHRDLKPSNLFCTSGTDGLPFIKVLDFGISKLSTTTIDDVITAQHVIMGSPRYMSPEQFGSPAEVDLTTDIWALGIILYELITGIVPFADSSMVKIWHRVKTVTPRPLEELRRDVPAALSPVVLRCLAKEPRERYQNVAELAKALLPFARDRARASVLRIIRIVEAPGVTTASIALAGQLREADAPEQEASETRSKTGAWTLGALKWGVPALAGGALAAWLALETSDGAPPPPTPAHGATIALSDALKAPQTAAALPSIVAVRETLSPAPEPSSAQRTPDPIAPIRPQNTAPARRASTSATAPSASAAATIPEWSVHDDLPPAESATPRLAAPAPSVSTGAAPSSAPGVASRAQASPWIVPPIPSRNRAPKRATP